MSRVLIFIVAFNAKRHIASVLARVPRSLVEDDRIQFLLIDDASTDDTAVIASVWAKAHDFKNLLVLRNSVNQGYGGNQKLGYRYAIDRGFDYVILLHGDGQYAPEELPRIVSEMEKQSPSVLLCSRTHSMRSALRGGMPLYKFIGNRMLTHFQNLLTGLQLVEYHTGYRAYSTQFLAKVPFELNTNLFHFDTELLLQAAGVGGQIAEIPIATHYGDEVCHVDGMRYARDVISATVEYASHHRGLRFSIKYQIQNNQKYQDKSKQSRSTHAIAIDLLQRCKARTVLDLGCGPGFVAERLEAQGVQVTALDKQQPLRPLKSFKQVDLEQIGTTLNIFDFDAVLLLDIIEHLSDPAQLLIGLRTPFAVCASLQLPLVLVSSPNVAFVGVRLGLLLGRFTYTNRGILDYDHKRFFTLASLTSMLDLSGYDIQRVMPIGAPLGIHGWGRWGVFFGGLATLAANVWPRMFAYQFLVTARPRPNVQQVLAAATKITDVGRGEMVA